jgi:predicted nucleic acid-binding protein
MSKFLLDTDVMIWHLRGRPEVTKTLRDLQAFSVPSCSALSLLEVRVGMKKGEEQKTDLFLGSLSVFDVTRQIADRAADLIREQKVKGVTLDLPDAVIAGTCLLHDLTLVTYNTKHYPMEEIKFHCLPPLG